MRARPGRPRHHGPDEDTVRAVTSRLDELWATSGIGPVRRLAGEPGVRARLYADARRSGTGGPV
ncbi:DUF6207 family protein [Streptomyces violaceusniger]|uniref:DUF6207 family protein n=1 Tax=Streptomyces violaceusniger TaxID=68280 RepID=UPI002074A641|nr:DUF6207 family protein [Streptomyces violaceusniger]